MDEIMVTVQCLAYNHEKYIRDALEGFVKQKTNFPFEVIVHDDASTDGMAKIIKEYEEKYPNIIKPIYQKVNQYSQGINIFEKYIGPNIHGKYIALCEGDDYWTDENKLQGQVDFLRKHNDYSAVVHNTIIIDGKTNKKLFVKKHKKDVDISIGEIIEWSQNPLHISSVLCDINKFTYYPELAMKTAGDFSFFVNLALGGKIRYINKTMSAYRYNHEESWTSSIRNDTKKMIIHINDKLEYLKKLDDFTSRKYSINIFREAIYTKALKENNLNHKIRYAFISFLYLMVCFFTKLK